MLKTESRMYIFIYDYACMTSLVTPRLFAAFKGEYPIFLSYMIFFFRMQTAFQINLLSFLIAILEGIQKWINTKNVRFFIQYGRYNKHVRKRLNANFMIEYWMTRFKFNKTSFRRSCLCFFVFFLFFFFVFFVFCFFVLFLFLFFCCCFFFVFVFCFVLIKKNIRFFNKKYSYRTLYCTYVSLKHAYWGESTRISSCP